jgi:hypothetical protein
MWRTVLVSTVLLVLSLGVATGASAQGWQERVYVSVSGAFQSTKNDFRDRFEFDENLERGFTEVDYPVDAGFIFDGGGGYRLFKNFGVGVAVSYYTREASAPTQSSFPHPFFFNQSREVTGDATGITRSETAIHVQAQYLWDPSGPLRLVLSAGPSFFTVKQEIVTDVRIGESFPFDTATFGSATVRTVEDSKPAFNVGADVMWMFSQHFGVGGIVRFARTSIDLPVPENRTISVDAGGVYAGGGIRLIF